MSSRTVLAGTVWPASWPGRSSLSPGASCPDECLVTTVEEGFRLDTRIGLWLVFLSLTVVVAGGVRRLPWSLRKSCLDDRFLYQRRFNSVGYQYSKVMPILWLIVRSAFTPAAGTGGFAGATIMQAARFGVARGVYSLRAGMGSGMEPTPVPSSIIRSDRLPGDWANLSSTPLSFAQLRPCPF